MNIIKLYCFCLETTRNYFYHILKSLLVISGEYHNNNEKKGTQICAYRIMITCMYDSHFISQYVT